MKLWVVEADQPGHDCIFAVVVWAEDAEQAVELAGRIPDSEARWMDWPAGTTFTVEPARTEGVVWVDVQNG